MVRNTLNLLCFLKNADAAVQSPVFEGSDYDSEQLAVNGQLDLSHTESDSTASEGDEVVSTIPESEDEEKPAEPAKKKPAPRKAAPKTKKEVKIAEEPKKKVKSAAIPKRVLTAKENKLEHTAANAKNAVKNTALKKTAAKRDEEVILTFYNYLY